MHEGLKPLTFQRFIQSREPHCLQLFPGLRCCSWSINNHRHQNKPKQPANCTTVSSPDTFLLLYSSFKRQPKSETRCNCGMMVSA